MSDRGFLRISWACHAALALAAAWVAARSVNEAAGILLRPPPPDLALAAPMPAAPRPATAPLSDAALSRLLGVSPPAGDAGPAAPGAALPSAFCGAFDRPMVKSTLGLALLAGVLTDAPERSLATVAVLATHETRLLAPDGKLFRVYSIQPGSIFAALGLENGDGLQRVNGYVLDSPAKALELYERLHDSARVVLELDRGGRTVRKEYAIVP